MLCRVGLGIIAALRETDAAVFDFQRSYIVEERRLQEEPGPFGLEKLEK